MNSNGEQAADPARRAVENVNLNDPQAARKRHVQHRGGTHSLQLHHLRERHCAPNRTCLHGDTRKHMWSCREKLRRLRCMRRLWCPRPAPNQSTPSGSTSRRRRRLRLLGDASDRRTQEQHVVCVICSARSWQTERPTAIQSGTCGVPARIAEYQMKTSRQ